MTLSQREELLDYVAKLISGAPSPSTRSYNKARAVIDSIESIIRQDEAHECLKAASDYSQVTHIKAAIEKRCK